MYGSGEGGSEVALVAGDDGGLSEAGATEYIDWVDWLLARR